MQKRRGVWGLVSRAVVTYNPGGPSRLVLNIVNNQFESQRERTRKASK